MHIEQSSTIVKKNLQPFIVETKKGPYKSQWIKSKQLSEIWVFLLNGNLICLAKGHTSQWNVSEELKRGTWVIFNKVNLSFDKCPNLECHTCG